MWWIVTILFLIISIISSAMVYFSLKRIEQYEEYLLQIQDIITHSDRQLKIIDEKGTFESDDEVGFFFSEIKSIQLVLNNMFEIENDEEIKDAKKQD